MSTNLNKVNMSLDEIINNQRRNKKDINLVKGARQGGFNQNRRPNFKPRRNFENQEDRRNRQPQRGGNLRGRVMRRGTRHFIDRNENFDRSFDRNENRGRRGFQRGFKRFNNDGFNRDRRNEGGINQRRQIGNRQGPRRNYISKPTDKKDNFRRLFVSNLHKDIINSELKNIFSRVGPLRRCGIHWDNLGNSKGTADVEYERSDDARKAIDEFDNAEIDGMPMRVSVSKSGSRRGPFMKRLGTRRRIGNSRQVNMK